MQIGDNAYVGFYAGTIDDHHIICSPIEYELPVEVNWWQANEYCKTIGMELPTKEELNLLYSLSKLRPEYFPNRKYHWYWSSTERSSTAAWIHYFDSDYQGTSNTTFTNFVRPIIRIKV